MDKEDRGTEVIRVGEDKIRDETDWEHYCFVFSGVIWSFLCHLSICNVTVKKNRENIQACYSL